MKRPGRRKLNSKGSNIFLTGFMGAGKTTVGKMLARRLSRAFIDTDDMIVKRQKISINEIFATRGEQGFRGIESQILRAVCRRRQQVVALGGGALLSALNRRQVKQAGTVIYLKASVRALLERAAPGTRPLLKGLSPTERRAFVKARLAQREKFYRMAHLTVQVGNQSAREVTRRILKELEL